MDALVKFIRRIIPATETSFVVPAFPLPSADIDLWFSNNLYYSSGGSITATDELSISRASIGYANTTSGTLTQFGNNTLRITDLGLLIEDTRTNLIRYSQDLTQYPAYWNAPSGGTISGDAASAPDGSATADQFIENTATTEHGIRQNLSGMPFGNDYTLSVYVKSNGRNFYFGLSDTETGQIDANVDLSSGTISGQVGGIGSWTNRVASIEVLANSWYRATIKGTKGGTGSSAEVILRGFDGTGSNYTGDGASGFYLWGAQVEQGSYASSYIPTTTTSAARAADNITIIGLTQTDIAASTASLVLQTNNSESTGFAANVVDSNGTNLLGFNASNNAIASITSTLTTANTGNRSATVDKLGLAWSAAGRSLVLNSGVVVTDATAQTPSSTQNLGSASGTSNFIYAYVVRLTVWTSKLSNAALQGFTL